GSRCAPQGGILLSGARAERQSPRGPGAGREPLPENRARRARGEATGATVKYALAVGIGMGVLAPAAASAQPVPTNPLPDAPRTLAPGAAGDQTPPSSGGGSQQNPGVIIIGPDGKPMSGGSA